jgi:broad specificity phosphatase PhoE
MCKLYLVATGRTTWEEQARFEAAIGSPLTVQGAIDIQRLGRHLSEESINALYGADSQSELQTLGLLADALKAKVRLEISLRDLDFGLWQGLTVQELQRSQPKLYRQWLTEPMSVRPPGGETLYEAAGRLQSGMEYIFRRHRRRSAVLVLRPLMLALVRCILEKAPASQLWEHAALTQDWYEYELKQAPMFGEIYG